MVRELGQGLTWMPMPSITQVVIPSEDHTGCELFRRVEEGRYFIDNQLVRINLIAEMIQRTGLGPRVFGPYGKTMSRAPWWPGGGLGCLL